MISVMIIEYFDMTSISEPIQRHTWKIQKLSNPGNDPFDFLCFVFVNEITIIRHYTNINKRPASTITSTTSMVKGKK